jgi:hypothetical protein
MRRCKVAARDHACTRGCAADAGAEICLGRRGPLHIVTLDDWDIDAATWELVIMPPLVGSLPRWVQGLRPRAGPLHIVAVVAAAFPPGRASLRPLPTGSSTMKRLSRQGPRTVERIATMSNQVIMPARMAPLPEQPLAPQRVESRKLGKSQVAARQSRPRHLGTPMPARRRFSRRGRKSCTRDLP